MVGLSGNLDSPTIRWWCSKPRDFCATIPTSISCCRDGGSASIGLREMQAAARLPNVSLVDRVPEADLEAFLSAADVWLIPYRKDLAGVSVPSRFYNLLAIGRPVVLVSEANAEAALTVTEDKVGWVVRPGDAAELARIIRLAVASEDPLQFQRAAAIAVRFNLGAAMAEYSNVVWRPRRKA